jgi:N6-adenosine-specific RNA methylase IME4
MAKALTVKPFSKKKQPPPINISEISRALAKAETLGDVADINKKIAQAESIMRESGMFQEDEVREVNEYRMRARRKLGGVIKSLPKQIVVAPGPGRGKKPKLGGPKTVFGTSKVAAIKEIELDLKAALQAERIHAMSQPEQERSFEATRKDETLNSYASQEKWARPWWYKESREDRHQTIASAAGVAGSLGPFPLLYADPPTKFATFSEKGLERTPDQHYPTLTWDEVSDFKVGGLFVRELAMKTAALLMWCTSSNQHHALKVMEAWDFEFKASAAWGKTKSDGKTLWTGTGLIFRNAHEVLLYGTRGNMPGPQWQPPSLFLFPRGRHSEKPAQVRKMIERMYPDFKDEKTRCELFARGQFKGWTCHGLEALSEAAQ